MLVWTNTITIIIFGVSHLAISYHVNERYILHRLVLKSIGYKSVPIEGLPFDDIKGRHAHFHLYSHDHHHRVCFTSVSYCRLLVFGKFQWSVTNCRYCSQCERPCFRWTNWWIKLWKRAIRCWVAEEGADWNHSYKPLLCRRDCKITQLLALLLDCIPRYVWFFILSFHNDASFWIWWLLISA